MELKLPKPHLRQTKKALEEYDATQAERDALLNRVETDGDVYYWNLAEKKALDKVREAFYEDTKDRNSKDNCMILDLTTLREWAETFT